MSSQQEPMLPDTAWQFWRVNEGDEMDAWKWEIKNETCFICHWLDLTEDQRQNVRFHQTNTWPILERPIDTLDEGDLQLREKAYSATSIGLHVIEIQWGAGVPRIIKELTKWVKNHNTEKKKKKVDKSLLPKPLLRGRHEKPKSHLLELAIFRLRKHYDSQETFEILKQFRNWVGTPSSDNDQLSILRQSRARTNIKAELARLRGSVNCFTLSAEMGPFK